MGKTRSNKRKWVIPGILTILLGTAGAVTLNNDDVEVDLSSRVSAELQAQGLGWASVSFDARDAKITGTAPNEKAQQNAQEIVKSIYGVRTVSQNIDLLASVSPYPFSAIIDGGNVILSGGAPDDATKSSLLARSLASSDSLELLAGSPEKSKWLSATDFALRQINKLEEGEVSLSDLTISISGVAKSRDDYNSLQKSFSSGVPNDIILGNINIIAPPASPFEWSATYKDDKFNIFGSAPSEEISETYSKQAPDGAKVTNNTVISSGEPSDFADVSSNLMKAFAFIEYGDASISDKSSNFYGAPRNEEAADKINALLEPLGTNIRLEPPKIADYRFYADRQNGKTSLSGYVPHETEKTRLGELDGFDVSKLKLGWGAPEGFDKSVEFGLSALENLSEGRFSLENDEVSLVGTAKSVDDYDALADLISSGINGANIKLAQISPPTVETYSWSAQKSAEGVTTLTGFAPSDDIKGQLEIAGAGAIDEMSLAKGAPGNFEENAKAGLKALSLLDSGEVKLEDDGWTLTGQASSYAIATQINESLDSAQWNVDIASPPKPLPVASPYLFSIDKDENGLYVFSGYVPQESLKVNLALQAKNVSVNNTGIARGEPDNFSDDALAGLATLAKLEKGRVAFNGTEWSLIGSASSQEVRELALENLGQEADALTWQVDISAPIPVASKNYRFVASKPADGAISINGDVPTSQLQNYIGIIAGKVATDDLNMLSPAPDNYKRSVFAGIAALKTLQQGQLSLRSEKWYFSGVASDEEAREKLLAQIANIEGAADWNVNITVPAPAPKPVPIPEPVPAPAPVPVAKPEPKPIPVASENYRFVATKLVDGSFGLNGDTPSVELQNYTGILAGNIATDNLSILYPAPDSYKRSLFTGIRALKLLNRVSYLYVAKNGI